MLTKEAASSKSHHCHSAFYLLLFSFVQPFSFGKLFIMPPEHRSHPERIVLPACLLYHHQQQHLNILFRKWISCPNLPIIAAAAVLCVFFTSALPKRYSDGPVVRPTGCDCPQNSSERPLETFLLLTFSCYCGATRTLS